MRRSLRDSDPEQLDATRGALSEARSAAEFIERFVSEQVGSAQGVDLSPLKQLLRQTMQILGEQSVASADNEPVDSARLHHAKRVRRHCHSRRCTAQP